MSPIEKIIQAFGGTSRMAMLCGVSPAAVSNWKAAGKIPPRWHYVIANTAKRRRLQVDLGLFEEDLGIDDLAALRASTRALMRELETLVDVAPASLVPPSARAAVANAKKLLYR